MLSSFLVRLVGKSKIQQRKCNAYCAHLGAFQTHLTLIFVVHTLPARSSAVKLQSLALRPLISSVETVCLGKEWRPVSHVERLSLSSAYLSAW